MSYNNKQYDKKGNFQKNKRYENGNNLYNKNMSKQSFDKFTKPNGKPNNNNKFNKSFDDSKYAFSKDRDDIYEPKTYPKKKKERSFYDNIILPEYDMGRERMRQKREQDKKHKKHSQDNCY